MAARAVLIVGGNGFVGTHLARQLREGYRVITTFHTKRVPIPGVLSLPLDFREEHWTKQLIYRFRPEIVIYLSGSQDFEWIDRNLPAAERVVSTGPGEIIRHAEIFQPRLIFLSSAYVFDGSRGNYTEKESISPYNNFGKLKASAENLVRGRASNPTVIRSSALLGCGTPHRPSFIDQLRFSLARGERIELQNHELHSFGAIETLARLIDQVIQTAPKKGLYHFGGLTRITHYEVAQRFARMHGFDEKLISARKRPGSRFMQHTEHDRLDFSLNFSEAVNQFQTAPEEIDAVLAGVRIREN